MYSSPLGAYIGGIDIAKRVCGVTGGRSTGSDSAEVARIKYEREQRPINGIADHDAARFARLHLRLRRGTISPLTLLISDGFRAPRML